MYDIVLNLARKKYESLTIYRIYLNSIIIIATPTYNCGLLEVWLLFTSATNQGSLLYNKCVKCNKINSQ